MDASGPGAQPVGRITGRSVSEIRIRAPADAPVRLGEILLTEGERPTYLRVVDLEYGADAQDGWEERTAGALLSAPDDLVLFDREDRIYTTAVTSMLGVLDAGAFRKPKSLPPQFAPVRRPRTGDFAFLAPKKDQLIVGNLRSGDEVLSDAIGVDPAAFAQHVGIFATTGMGKSNLLKVIAAGALESGRLGLLLLDPHGEYADGGSGKHPDGRPHRGLLHHPRGDRLQVYTSRAILGFEGRVRSLVVAAQEIHPLDVQNIYHLTEPQAEAVWAAYAKWNRDWLVRLGSRQPEQLYAEFGEKFHVGTWAVLVRRAERILQSGVVHTDGDLSTSKSILNHLDAAQVVLVDTSGLDPREELLVSAVLARKLLDHHRNMAREPKAFRDLPPAYVVLEEAQRVLNARGGSENIFAQIAREGRKFKVGLGAVTQQPRLIEDELLSQFNTLMVLGLADPTDRDRVAAGARQDLTALKTELQLLEPGEAILTTPGAPFALPFKAPLYEDILASAPAPVVKAAVRPDRSFY